MEQTDLTTKERIIILFSGGYDSTLLLEMAISLDFEPLCLIMDYGQVHSEEIKTAKGYCLSKSIEYRIVNAPILASSKLTDGVRAGYEGVSEWHVPSRNLIFISLAASVAESERINTIWYGANFQDRENLFPDCYQEWVYQLNKLLAINGSRPILVEAPLLGMTKPLIKRLAEELGISQDQIYSGYGDV